MRRILETSATQVKKIRLWDNQNYEIYEIYEIYENYEIYGMEKVTFQSPFLWANLHTKYKNAKSLDEFKLKMKAWKCYFFQCRLLKKYAHNLGFI